MRAKRVAVVAVLIALATVLNVVEALLIPSLVVGLKLGLANIVTMVAMFVFGPQVAVLVALFRTSAAALLKGTFLSFNHLLSFSGALLSVAVLWVFFAANRRSSFSTHRGFSVVFMSIFGALAHNLGQLAAAYLLVGYGVVRFLPYVILFALPTGFLTGKICAGLLEQRSFILAWQDTGLDALGVGEGQEFRSII